MKRRNVVALVGTLLLGGNAILRRAFAALGKPVAAPAMAAVAGLVTRRVFALYVGFALFGAIVAGYAYSLVQIVW